LSKVNSASKMLCLIKLIYTYYMYKEITKKEIYVVCSSVHTFI